MSRLYNILNELVGTSETLATGATIYRNGKKRKLVFSSYEKTANAFTLQSSDAPSEQTVGVGLRTNSSGLGTALGQIAVRTTGVVDFYYAGTYNAAGSGLSNLATGDRISAICEYVVGGVVNRLLSRISSIFSMGGGVRYE